MQNKYNSTYKNIQYTLTLTHTAKKQIKKIINNDTYTFGIRINVKKTGCAGLSYIFDKVNKNNFDHTDLIFKDDNNVKLFIPYNIISIINGSEIDYIQNGLNYIFKFNNPNVRHLCGCGESFNI